MTAELFDTNVTVHTNRPSERASRCTEIAREAKIRPDVRFTSLRCQRQVLSHPCCKQCESLRSHPTTANSLAERAIRDFGKAAQRRNKAQSGGKGLPHRCHSNRRHSTNCQVTRQPLVQFAAKIKSEPVTLSPGRPKAKLIPGAKVWRPTHRAA